MTMSLLARRHLLHLKKNKKMTMSRGGSPSSATPEKKKQKQKTNKEMTMSQGGSSSSATPKKNAEDDNKLGGS